MHPDPVLVDTETAAAFIVTLRGCSNSAATAHVYYLAKCGRITRYGGRGRGNARWDLRELAEPYRGAD